MANYINRDKLLDSIDELFEMWGQFDGTLYVTPDRLKDFIENEIPVEAVAPIVYCKYCVHRKEDKETHKLTCSKYPNIDVCNKYFFCGSGEIY